MGPRGAAAGICVAYVYRLALAAFQALVPQDRVRLFIVGFLDARREPFNSTPMGVNPIPSGSPHVRCTPMGRTRGEPNEIKGKTHPTNTTALLREQGVGIYNQHADNMTKDLSKYDDGELKRGDTTDYIWNTEKVLGVGDLPASLMLAAY